MNFGQLRKLQILTIKQTPLPLNTKLKPRRNLIMVNLLVQSIQILYYEVGHPKIETNDGFAFETWGGCVWSENPTISEQNALLWRGRIIFILEIEKKEKKKKKQQRHEPWCEVLEQEPQAISWRWLAIQFVFIAICFINYGACMNI